MEKKTIDTLRAMICGEIEDIAKKGSLSHETLDILKDLVETEKNLGKIEKMDKEKKEMEYEMDMDQGYSQRKYYIDADYDPYSMNSYRNSYAQRNSYDRGMATYDMNGGNSYRPYNMSYARNNSYSRTGDKNEMIMEIRELMAEATDEKTKEALQKTLTELNK